MAALPYMQFYVADYLADTTHLTTLEHGAYLLLIMNYWQTGHPLPNDDRRLSRICRLSECKFKKIKSNLIHFFSICEKADSPSETVLVHSRIEKELEKVREKSCKAKTSISKRWEKVNNENDTNVLPTNNERNTDVILSDQIRSDTETDKEYICPNPPKTPVLDVSSSSDFFAFFDDFWRHYPRKEAKADAKKAWKQMKASQKWDVILTDLQTKRWERGTFTPLAATYLRGNRWEDEDIKPSATHRGYETLQEANKRAGEEFMAMVLAEEAEKAARGEKH